MARPTPIDRESPFGLEELFFSRTDKQGVILSGNDVFVRVSGYPRSRLVGSPHNIIRHPDMPKTIFRLFWDTLEAGRPICAYVKNLAADGSYYWVVASAFPIEDGYLSVRLKPSSALFSKVTALYSNLLDKEKKEGVEPALALLAEALKAEGFETYEQLMAQLLTEEIKARSKAIGNQTESDYNQSSPLAAAAVLRSMGKKCIQNGAATTQIFSRLDNFTKVNSSLSERSTFILRTFKKLDLLAINMSTAAKRLGVSGATLVAVSTGITKSAGEFKVDLAKFNASAKRLGESMARAEFQIAASQLQVGMIEFYIRETLAKWATTGASPEEFEEMKVNSKLLLAVADASIWKLKQEMGDLRNLLVLVNGDAETLRATINSVEIIRKAGVIEAAQLSGEGSGEFETYFRGMNELVGETGRSLATFADSLRNLVSDVDFIIPALGKVGANFTEIARESSGLILS